MSQLQECLDEMAARLPPGAVTPLENGAWRVADGDAAVTVAFGEGDADFVCHATVGSLEGVSDKDLLMEDALKANCFWNETNGATLSVNPESGELVLADRREADFTDDGAGLATFLALFFDTLRRWRQYIADCSPEPAAEAETNPETPGEEIFA